MKSLGQFLEEAKATYCGRCGTTHVPPSKGGTCPALKEEREISLSHRHKHDTSHFRVLNNGKDVSRHDNYEDAKAYAAKHRGKLRKDGYNYNRVTVHAYVKEEEQIDELSADTLSSYTDKASDAKGHRNLSTKKVDNRYKGVALAQKKGDKQAAKMGPKKLKPVKTDYERQMDAAHGQIYREEKETTMKTLRQFLEQVNTVEDQIDETVENELTEADMQAHVQRVKKKKNQDVSFTHSQSGKKVTGKMMGIKTRGGMPYAHVETGKMAYHVPVHQVD